MGGSSDHIVSSKNPSQLFLVTQLPGYCQGEKIGVVKLSRPETITWDRDGQATPAVVPYAALVVLVVSHRTWGCERGINDEVNPRRL